jgi:hypothetical protein
MRRGHLALGLLAAMLVAGDAEAHLGGTVKQFNETLLVKKLQYKPLGTTQRVVIGPYKGFVAHQYVAPDARSFIDLVVSPKGVIVEQAMLLPIQPNPIDAARFVEFMREATQNGVNMNDVFKFMYQAVQVAKDSRKQFGRYDLHARPQAQVVVDVKVTVAGTRR